MRRLVAAINMTLDGNCDHTAVTPDAEVHKHYADFIRSIDTILFGRITYELMKFWPEVLANPTGDKAMDDFAVAIDAVPKLVFSRTLLETNWDTARLAVGEFEDVIQEMKLQPGRDIALGSRSLLLEALRLNLLDELQVCVHPVIAGAGMQLFDGTEVRRELQLVRTKQFAGGAILCCYAPGKA